MKKFLIYMAAVATAMSFASCEKDVIEVGKIDVNELERMPMTMFRDVQNTNKNEEQTYGCHVVHSELNSIYLSWYGIEGCAGYEVRYALQNHVSSGLAEDWDARYIEDIVINDPNQLDITIENLEYDTYYYFAIRCLSPKGEEYHSKWNGYGSGRQWDEYLQFKTDERYPTPMIMFPENKSYDKFDVVFNLDYAKSGDSNSNKFTENFEVVDGMYVAHTLVVKPSPTNPDAGCPEKWKSYKLTEADKAAGRITVDGLDPNSVYLGYLVNDNVPIMVDAMYNAVTVRTLGDVGEPIVIKHTTEAPDASDARYKTLLGTFNQDLYDTDVLEHEGAMNYNACRLDTILTRYNTDITLAEGQVFYLEGDKNYYFCGNFSLCKGFTLATLPEDLAQGKRAKVFLGGYRPNGAVSNTNNFMFGRPKESGEVDAAIEVGDVIFKGLDFDAPLAHNFGEGNQGQNYFCNMYSNGMAVTFESFQVLDCTFQRMIRGFIRVQGSKRKIFKHININGCLFYNNGYYDNNGRGYAWFAGDGNNAQSNIYNDVRVTNCTIYDCPRTCMFTDNGKDLAWADDVNYNITLENNTIINFSTRSSGRHLFDLRYLPGGSTITCRNNLFVLAADENDGRNLYFTGMDIRYIRGSGLVKFDFKDNYSAGCRDQHLKDDGIFTGNAFSAKKNAAGAYVAIGEENPGWGVVNGVDELKIKVGSTPLKATDLFKNPNPRNTAHNPSSANGLDHAAPDNIYDALMYKMSSGHEILDKHIGDQRWASSNPKTYWSTLEPMVK